MNYIKNMFKNQNYKNYQINNDLMTDTSYEIKFNKTLEKIENLYLDDYSPKKVILLDLDHTLLFRTQIFKIEQLHNKRNELLGIDKKFNNTLSSDNINPKPDLIRDNYFVYTRPKLYEFLSLLNNKYGKENIHVYTAGDFKYAMNDLKDLNMLKFINKVFARNHTITQYIVDNDQNEIMYLLKDIKIIRQELNLDYRDKVLMIDDHPEWIKHGFNDKVISIEPFLPSFKLYDIINIEDDECKNIMKKIDEAIENSKINIENIKNKPDDNILINIIDKLIKY